MLAPYLFMHPPYHDLYSQNRRLEGHFTVNYEYILQPKPMVHMTMLACLKLGRKGPKLAMLGAAHSSPATFAVMLQTNGSLTPADTENTLSHFGHAEPTIQDSRMWYFLFFCHVKKSTAAWFTKLQHDCLANLHNQTTHYRTSLIFH